MSDCPFCDPGITEELKAYAMRPYDPVTEGHMLIVPKLHLRHAHSPAALLCMPSVLQHVERLSMNGFHNYNLIVNQGPAASQTVEHLHWHYVPRRPNDGLMLPWTNQIKTEMK